MKSWDSVVGTAIGYGLDDRGVGGRVKNFIFSTSSRPALGFTHLYPTGTGGTAAGA
jgi:hypothetical protein